MSLLIKIRTMPTSIITLRNKKGLIRNDFDSPVAQNGKLKSSTTNARKVQINIRHEYYDVILQSEYTASKLIDIALTNYFKNGFVMRLDNIIQLLYEEILMLDKLKEVGKMGTIEFNEDYLLQIESVKEAIRILENSPLMEGKVQ